MLNISGIQDGYVIDHIRAGKSMDIYKYLRLDKLDCQVAIIKNATSNKITNVIRCKNPRCISTVEQELPQRFKLTDAATRTYRCIYCEEKFDSK